MKFDSMRPEAIEAYGDGQLADLRGVLSRHGDTDAQIKAPQDTLKKHSGREINIAAIARTNGAQSALDLLLHADALARRV